MIKLVSSTPRRKSQGNTREDLSAPRLASENGCEALSWVNSLMWKTQLHVGGSIARAEDSAV